MSRRRIIVLFMVLSLVVAACGGGDEESTSSTTAAPSGSSETTSAAGDATTTAGSNVEQVLTYGINGPVPVLKAGTTQGNVGITVNALIHRGLLTYDAQGHIVEGLAESWESSDPAHYSFTLREGLTFHDGSAVTSENVKNSLLYYAEPDTGANAIFQEIESIETPDSLTVEIALSANDSSFPSYLALADTTVVPDSALSAETANTVGAGPFKWAAQAEGVSTTVEKFDGYYAAGDVTLETIELVYYTDGAARVNALLSGDVDLIDYVPWESFRTIDGDDSLVLDAQVGPFLMTLFNTDTGPFADPLVRQAVAHAINRDNIVDISLLGNGKSLYGVIVPEGGEYDTELATDMYSYDPELAKSLLAQSGYPDGFTANISTSSQHAFLQDTAISMQADLAELGIDLTFDGTDFAALVEKLNGGEYEIAVSGGVGAVTDPSWLLRFVGGSQNFEHSFGYNNPDLTTALQTGLRTGEVSAYEDAFRIIAEDVPILFMTQRAQGYAYTTAVEGFANIPGFTTNQSAYTFASARMTEN